MKIAIIGYSGSGKSTLAKLIGEKYSLPVLHLDKVHWLPSWKERELCDELIIVKDFLSENDGWVIDGNYKKLEFERRMDEAEKIIFMRFGRLSTLSRVIKRYRENKGKARDSITEGCDEKIDLEFLLWVLFFGRTKKRRKLYAQTARKYPLKFTVIKNQKELDAYIKALDFKQ